MSPLVEHQSERMYVLIDMRSRYQGSVVFWRPNNAGYTNSLTEAGLYAESAIKANPTYYDTEDTVPVPIDWITQNAYFRKIIDVGNTGNGIFYSAKKLREAMRGNGAKS